MAAGALWAGLAMSLAVLVVVFVAGVPDARTAAIAATGVLVVTIGVLTWVLHVTRSRLVAHEEALIAWSSERAVTHERLRIARDLHDLASHGLGLITVRAASTRSLQGPDADAERAAALADIEQAARGATTELRRLLAVLRDGDGDPAPLRPQAGLADIEAAVTRTRDAGVDVTLDLAPELVAAADVSGGVQSAAYAVVAEALANVARHAGPTRARVRVARVSDGLAVEVDDGPVAGWRPEPGAGLGLTGLRERVAAVGGTLTAGPTDAGFGVRAHLPEEAS
ncbi:hypothetical protein GCM10027418_17050 [Mariniluteicoccus endophyticus]